MTKEIKGKIESVHPMFLNNSRQKQQTVFVKSMDDQKIKKLTLFGNKVTSFFPISEKGRFKFYCEVRNVLGLAGKSISYYNVVGFCKIDELLN